MLLALLLACPGPEGTDSKDTNSGSTDAVCEEPTEVGCVDEMVLNLSLHDDKTSDGEVTNTVEGGDFVTTVDASGHGYDKYTKYPFVYMKFQDDGLVRVDIDDESALESMDWDIAARRYIIRLNGGSSGPSCVGAATLGEGYTYETLTEVPDGLSYPVDAYYTSDCTLVNDSSGLEGSPQTVLSPWWSYPGCVATSDQPFLIQLADGRIVKFRVESYYANDGQQECNEDGATMESGGFFIWRWAFMN